MKDFGAFAPQFDRLSAFAIMSYESKIVRRQVEDLDSGINDWLIPIFI